MSHSVVSTSTRRASSSPAADIVLTRPRDSYSPEINGLRALAALTAVLYHYASGLGSRTVETGRELLAATPFAVDMFFIISGFLIGGVLLRHRDSTTYYRTFYLRRFYRILPIYYLLIAAAAVLYVVAGGWGLAIAPGRSVALTFTSLLFLFQNCLPGLLTGSFMLSPTWTLAVEEHFYLLGPLCVRGLSRRRLMQVLAGIIALSPIVRALLFRYAGDWGGKAVEIWTFCRADGLAFGVLTAVIWARPEQRRWIGERAKTLQWGTVLFGAIGLLLVCASQAGVPLTATINAAFSRTLTELCCVSLFLFVLVRPQSRTGNVLKWPILQEIGKVSYCLYLVHWTVLWMLYRFVLGIEFHTAPWLILVTGPIALVMSLAVARLSWRYIEQPMIRRGHQYTYETGASTPVRARQAVCPREKGNLLDESTHAESV